MAFFSIVIPTYNCGHIVARSVESVVRQQFSDYELIIQDGLSGDNTLQVIEDIRKKYPGADIRVFSEKDSGIYDAMNKATAHAKGRWIYFLGSDDYLYNDSILAQVHRSLENAKVDMIYGDVYSGEKKGVYGGKFNYERLMYFNICHQAIFIRKEVLQQYGLFDTRFFGLADWDLNVKLFKARIKAKYIPLLIAHFSEGGFSFDCRHDPFVQVLDKKRQEYKPGLYTRFKAQVKKLLPVNIISRMKKVEKKVW